MRDVYEHVQKRIDSIQRIPKMVSRYTIVPKTFAVEEVSHSGRKYLSFEKGQRRTFTGRLMTERPAGFGRVFFFPYPVQLNGDSEERRFIEIKGYGQDGRDMCLWTHCDGDILFGMFYKNAKKEFDILEKAFSQGLHVPMPLFIGRIPKEEWLRSGLRIVEELSDSSGNWDLEKLLEDRNLLIREITSKMNGHPPQHI